VTQNNDIKIDDASEIQRSLASMLTLEKTAEFASDTNNDGKITIDDATALQRYLASYPTGIGIVGKTVIYG
ncbi:MAG: dockerin type I domain-containing protein, partial [Ruminococcus sp.]|nr:dockerin type I domain-containing protein [Ruminococcus sp.]